MLPSAFVPSRALRRLAVAGAAASFAAFVSGALMHFDAHWWVWSITAGLPTLVCATLAAAIGPRFAKTGRFWLFALALGMLDAIAVEALVAFVDRTLVEGDFPASPIAVASLGAILWVPGVVVGMAIFGLPLAHAARRASQGVGAEEPAMRVVGWIAALVASLALAFAWSAPRVPISFGGFDGRAYADWLSGWDWGAPPFREGGIQLFVKLQWVAAIALHALAAAGLASGLAMVAIATRRRRRRADFLDRVERGREPQFEVRASPHGRLLVRVHPASYRSVHEEVALFAE